MKHNKKITMLFSMILLFAGSLFSAFDITPTGARAVALSEGFCAVADNVTALHSNPGGLGQLHDNQFYCSFVSQFEGLDNYIYNGAFDFSFYNINLGVLALAWSGLFTDLYQENTLTFSYGNGIFPALFKNSKNKLYAGFNLKILQKGYKENGYTLIDPVFEKGMSRFGVSIDAGLLLKLAGYFSIGLSGFDLNSPDMGLAAKSVVPPAIRGGISWDLIPFFRVKDKGRDSANLDWFKLFFGSQYRGKEYRLSPGLEFSIFKMFNISGAYSLGENSFKKISAGLGFTSTRHYPAKVEKKIMDGKYILVESEKVQLFKVNYAFVYFLNSAHQYTYGNHYLECGVQF